MRILLVEDDKDLAEYLKKGIQKIDGFSIPFSGPTFNEFAVQKKGATAKSILEGLDILGGVDLGRFDDAMNHLLLVAVTECHTRDHLDTFLDALAKG